VALVLSTDVPFWRVLAGVKSVRRAWRTVVARAPEEPSMSVCSEVKHQGSYLRKKAVEGE
jgi:hypothetical protein